MTVRRRFMDEAAARGAVPMSQICDMTPQETYVFQRVRRSHCAHEKGNHDCVGRMTIDAGGVTLQCELCGSLRSLNADHEKPPRK